jgi:membrane protein involved in colicin uptake
MKARANVEEKEARAIPEAVAEAKTAKEGESTEAKTQTTKESKAKAVAEAKTAKVEEKEAKARVEAITGATKRKEAKAEADAIITEARIKSTEKAKELAEKTKQEAEAKVAEITQQANDARATASSLLGNENPFKGLTTSLQGLKKEVGTEATQTMDVYANAMKAVGQSVGQSRIDKAKNKINKVNPL